MQSLRYGSLDGQMKYERAMNKLYTRKNLPMRAKESPNRNLMRLSETTFRINKCFQRRKQNFIDFSLELSRLKI